MSQHLRGACVAAIIFACTSATINAQTTTAVAAPPSLSAWSQKVFQDLDRHPRVQPPMVPSQPQTGIAAVKFNCSESGAPAGVALYKTSGNRELDRATVRAVREIVTLHPLPKGLGLDQQYIVRVLFTNTQEGAKRQIAQMRKEATERNAWYDKNQTSTAAIELVPVG